ncbi:MAG: tRNA (5-methylaminomethyl-2-thiouridine)(34)-methyltransferase MnmD [Planktomarina sp.]
MSIDHSTPAYQNLTPQLEWRDGVPFNADFDDPYYSLDDGPAETRHVFMQGNGLPDRFVDGFHIAETGFGTGLNFLVALKAWRQAGIAGHLHFTSFEAFPLEGATIRQAHAQFPEFESISSEVNWDNHLNVTLPDATLTVIKGDARTQIPAWDGKADAWFLDGFSPARNPELWGADLLMSVGNHTTQGGTCATYSAAGAIRQSLSDAGFDIARVAGFGRKKHMTVGVKT